MLSRWGLPALHRGADLVQHQALELINSIILSDMRDELDEEFVQQDEEEEEVDDEADEDEDPPRKDGDEDDEA